MTCVPNLLLLLAAAVLTACDRTTSFEAEPDPEGTVSVAYLKSLCHADHYAIREELSIEGRVVSSNLFGEFGPTIVIEDPSGGISLSATRADGIGSYPFGARVRLFCNGLTLSNRGGKIRLTRPAGDDDRLPAEDLPYFLLRLPDDGQPPCPRRMTCALLSPRDIDTYVRFDHVRFTDTGRWCDYDPERGRFVTTGRRALDAAGDTLTVRTSGNASYAGEHLPEAMVSLWGVIDYFNGSYSLRLVDFGVASE